jgi:hypothetical protein
MSIYFSLTNKHSSLLLKIVTTQKFDTELEYSISKAFKHLIAFKSERDGGKHNKIYFF